MQTSRLLHSSIFTFFLCAFFAILALAGKQQHLFSEKIYLNLQEKYGQSVTERLDAWRALVDNNSNSSEYDKLVLVNNFFNQNVLWVDDNKLWKQKDYWATPLETLTKAAGDCEDFSIAKYYTLIALGVPIEKLKITYVKALKYNQAHMVLTYYESQKTEPLVLDNINKKILKGSKRKDLKPVYSFNGEGMWISKQKKLGKKVGSSQRIRLWTDLAARMANELEE